MAWTQTNMYRVSWRLAVAVLSLAPAVLAQSETTTTTTSTTAEPTAEPTPTLPPVDPVFNPGVGEYSLIGCYAEPAGARALSTVVLSENQTVEACLDIATEAGAALAGVEYGVECWYGQRLHSGSRPRPLAECGFLCPGNEGELCGAGDRLLLYSVGGAVPPVGTDEPTQPATVGDYTFHGCVTEATGVRALSELAFTADDMTLEACAAFCDAYAYFGVEYSRECYCGNEFNEGSEPVPDAECSMACSGDGLQLCGAGDRLSAYARA